MQDFLILAAVAVFAGVGGHLLGASSGKGAAEDDIARLLQREEVSSACRQEVNNAARAVYEAQDARNAAYRGYSRY